MMLMLNEYFIKQGIKESQIEEFIRHNFSSTDFSRIELQRTPLGVKIVIHTHKPGRVIGKSGSKINEITDSLKSRFKLENPQLDVKTISNPNLDAKIIAKQIKTALERGYNYKRIGNISLKKIMEAGAIGTEIIISGKLGASKGRTGKFTDGYLKHCGDTAKRLVDFGFEEAITRPGKIGIQVRIMTHFMDIAGEIRRYDDEAPAQKAEPAAAGKAEAAEAGGTGKEEAEPKAKEIKADEVKNKQVKKDGDDKTKGSKKAE